MKLNVGFVSFRFAGTDGVSLETSKWDQILNELGAKTFYMGGELDTPQKRSFFVEETHFKHPKIRSMYEDCFSKVVRSPALTNEIHHYRDFLKKKLYEFIRKFHINLLIPQNSLTIPLNIPLGMALTEVIAETNIATIAHHHDFFWERKRFLRNCVWDYINACFPPHLPQIQHVVINSSAQNQLALRTGISSTLIPNVMDFENPPEPMDDYAQDVRSALDIRDDEVLIVQPTRVVQRKGIEHAIELVARLGLNATLVISHASGDEGYEYQNRVKEYTKLLGIKAKFVQEIIADSRGTTKEGRKIYRLEDVYPHADLITYPSLIEGFGNAFLEAIYFKKPIMVNNYSIYSHDIKPKGFDVIEIDNFISDDTISYTKEIIQNPQRQKQMVEINYQLGKKYYSYHILETKLRSVITSIWGKEIINGT